MTRRFRRLQTILMVLALTVRAGRAPAEDEAPAERAAPLALGVDAAAHAGVQTAVVTPASARPVIDALGRVLDPMPLVEATTAERAARSAETVARSEYERVTRLEAHDLNASRRDVEAARAALDKAAVDATNARARVALGWGVAADQAEAFVDELIAGRKALLRVDLPAGARLTSPPALVTIVDAPGADAAAARTARVLGRAPTVDPLVQGEAYFAVVADDPPRPGAVLTVRVPGGSTVSGVTVPASAVIWADGHPIVYTEPSAGTFERRPVTLGPRTDDHWIVTAGLATDERVVIAGAARLLSAEVVGTAPHED
jgi:hypothetical protein